MEISEILEILSEMWEIWLEISEFLENVGNLLEIWEIMLEMWEIMLEMWELFQEFRQGCWKLTHDRKVLFSRRKELLVGNEDQRLIAEHSLLIRFSSFSI